jgi:hypothetical protein
VSALGTQVGGQVVVPRCRIGVALAERLAADVQRPPEQRLGVGIPSLVVQVGSQVTVACAGEAVALAERLAADVQRPLQ